MRACRYQPGLFDLPGGYRPLLAFPAKLRSEVLPYTDHTRPLEIPDMDRLEGTRGGGPPPPAAAAASVTGPASEGQGMGPLAGGAAAAAAGAPRVRYAWRLAFELPPSAYATMLLRELLREPVDPEEHAARSKAACRGLHGRPAAVP